MPNVYKGQQMKVLESRTMPTKSGGTAAAYKIQLRIGSTAYGRGIWGHPHWVRADECYDWNDLHYVPFAVTEVDLITPVVTSAWISVWGHDATHAHNVAMQHLGRRYPGKMIFIHRADILDRAEADKRTDIVNVIV